MRSFPMSPSGDFHIFVKEMEISKSFTSASYTCFSMVLLYHRMEHVDLFDEKKNIKHKL